MKRVLAIAVLVVACAATVLVVRSGSEPPRQRYWVELNNAFGLVQDGDVKVAGVRAGTIQKLELDRKTQRAMVQIQIDRKGFGELRTDASCEVRPQSLIGEYFIDCTPGTKPAKLKRDGLVPVSRTTSTIAPDLVANVLRMPYRERLRIIIGELGAAVGGRGDTLNQALRQAVPALRETDRVLGRLAEQNRTLVSLTEDADAVVGDLADGKGKLTRFIESGRDAARDTAVRKEELADGFRRLPGFLAELKPTMAALGQTADAQGPAFRDLAASAGELRSTLDNLGPFSSATLVNLRGLARTGRRGRPAVRAVRPTVRRLTKTLADLPELTQNLDVVLDDLHDRGRAVEKDKTSPGGQGYTGFEALLQYVYDQVAAINIYDQNGYLLKVNALENECSSYQNAETLKEETDKDPEFLARCNAFLGPNQPGVTTPDVSSPSSLASRDRKAARRDGRDGDREDDRTGRPDGDTPQSAPGKPGDAPAAPGGSPTPTAPGSSLGGVGELLEGLSGATRGPSGPAPRGPVGPAADDLASFLLG